MDDVDALNTTAAEEVADRVRRLGLGNVPSNRYTFRGLELIHGLAE